MPDPSDLGAITLAVGQIQGQMRELIHTQNNMAMKIDGMTERVLLGPSGQDFAAALARISALETKESERRGATGLGAAILKSPAVGWLVGIAVAAIAAVKGDLFR